MNLQEFELLIDNDPKCPRIFLDELINKSERTLLWGYTSERNSWHVYLWYGLIVLYCYTFDDYTVIGESDVSFAAQSLIPNKRLYPEACDYEFCELLMSKGVYLPFTAFNSNREYQQFYGKLL